MPGTHTLVMQVSKTIHLFLVYFGVEYAAYIVEVIIACSEGGNFLSWCHFIAERKPPLRNVNKNKDKADHSS
jgi:hypothetical protein